MPVLHAGLDKRTGAFRKVDLTDSQMVQLGFGAKEKPEKIGCGANGCAYVASAMPNVVIKVTRDAQDAVASQVFRSLPDGYAPWAIPVYAVWRLPHQKFAIATARAGQLSRVWADAMDFFYEFTQGQRLEWDEWEAIHAAGKRFLEMRRIVTADAIELSDLTAKEEAMDLVHQAILGCRRLSLDLFDFHSDNWRMHQGRPVLTDLGIKRDVSVVPGGGAPPPFPEVRDIPMLPFHMSEEAQK